MVKKRILIADSEIYVVHILEFSLGMEGFEVITARDGAEVVGKAREKEPDVVVLGTTLPDGTGYEVYERMRADESLSGIPVVLLRDREEEGFDTSGCSDVPYVTKPFSTRRLIREIHSVLAASEEANDEAVGA